MGFAKLGNDSSKFFKLQNEKHLTSANYFSIHFATMLAPTSKQATSSPPSSGEIAHVMVK